MTRAELIAYLQRALEDPKLARGAIAAAIEELSWTGLRTPGSPVPTTPCSVVWLDGHPFVLDGEPGIAGPRVWVGMDDRGPRTYTTKEMSDRSPAIVYTDLDGERIWGVA